MSDAVKLRAKSASKVIVHWFRRDLRLEDNRAFSRALRRAAAEGATVLPFFVFDRTILGSLEDRRDARVAFIHATVAELKSELEKEGSTLYARFDEPRAAWRKLLAEKQIEIVGVTFNRDDEPRARGRDDAVAEILAKSNIPLLTFKDQVIFERTDVTKDDGKPYSVFTPFAKKWRLRLKEEIEKGMKPLENEKCRPYFAHLFKSAPSPFPALDELGFEENPEIEIPSPKVDATTLKNYAKLRDLPAIAGTSRLGLHLRFGTISIRRLVAKALELGAETWLSELIWREFFMQILWHFPGVSESAFRAEYDLIAWRNNEEEFRAWCEGRTGYPMVDAGMRELNSTGFMHNRVRMVAASFLVKHLLIDWRWGEAYFARKLLDFDLAANNGNWQWVAGSGCDAAPYFRVFNPEIQLKKFDPKGEYIRKWVPEFGTKEYVAPLVDHREARARVLRAYAVVKQKSP